MIKNKIISISISILLFIIINITIFNHLNSVKNEQISFLSQMIENEAKAIFENIVSTRQWSADFGGVYVKSNTLKPNPYLLNNTLKGKNGETLIKINPAWMTKQISHISNKKNKHTFHITSLNPINPDNKADEFETEALNYFENNKNKKFYTNFKDDFSDFKFMGVLKVNKSCLQCHISQNYNLDDVIGGISVNLPIKKYQEKYQSIKIRNENFVNFVIIFSLIVFVLSIAFIINYFDRKKVLLNNLQELKELKRENETLVKRYKYALEASQIGIWDWDLTTNEVYFDKTWKEMLGYEEDELPNTLETWDKKVHIDDKEKAIADIKTSHEGKTKFYKNIHRLQHKNGNWIWIYDKGKTYFDEENNPIRMIGSHTNITQLKELEVQLQEKEQNLSFAQEIAHMGHWKYHIKDDKFIASNSLLKLIGFNENKHTFNYNDFKNLIHPEDYENFVQFHKEALNNCQKRELQYRLKKFGTDKYIQINEHISCISTQNDKENKIYLGTMQDITHLKDLENDLELFSTIINNSPLSIIVTNHKGNIIYVNPYFTKASGYTKNEVLGKNPRFLKSPLTPEITYKDLWDTITNKKTWGGVFRNLTKDKEEYWETALIIPILDDKDEIINFLAIKREITKEIFLKKALEEKEELMLNQSKHAAMGEMISMIAHQWRQPITTISMAANNILADIELDMLNNEEAKKFVEEVSLQTQYLSNTIEDFRNFFKQDKTIETISFETIFNDTSSIILASLKNNGINFELDYDKQIAIATYRRELVQVLINIIKNAKEALQEKNIEDKTIQVKITPTKDKTIIEIIDNAGGIKENLLDKIFEAYFTTKDEQNGTGLGLYMSKMIIEKHLKGKINVYNNDKGATFKIELPNRID